MGEGEVCIGSENEEDKLMIMHCSYKKQETWLNLKMHDHGEDKKLPADSNEEENDQRSMQERGMIDLNRR